MSWVFKVERGHEITGARYVKWSRTLSIRSWVEIGSSEDRRNHNTWLLVNADRIWTKIKEKQFLFSSEPCRIVLRGRMDPAKTLRAVFKLPDMTFLKFPHTPSKALGSTILSINMSLPSQNKAKSTCPSETCQINLPSAIDLHQ